MSSSSTKSLNLHHHSAAIALNNTGITLLERGAYRQAVECFKDSVSLMKSLTSMGTQYHHLQQPSSTLSSIQSKLRQASYKLLHPISDEKQALNNGEPPITLQVISSEDSAPALVSALHDQQNNHDEEDSACPIFLIRIESSVLVRFSDEGHVDYSKDGGCTAIDHLLHMDTAALLHNFSGALMCLASLSNQDVRHLYNSAFSLSELSYSVFDCSYEALQSSSSSPKDDGRRESSSNIWTEYLPLAMLLLQNLAELAWMLGKQSAAQDFCADYAAVRDAFLEREAMFADMAMGKRPAAAA